VILPAHNATITEIAGPSEPADPRRAGSGVSPVVKWQGQCQAYLQIVTAQSVRNETTVIELETVAVTLPWNIPVYPAMNDLMTFTLLEGIIFQGGDQLTLKARTITESFEMAGYFTISSRRS
jgi:hypothetical protein